jgi:hypothetical protein
MARYPYDITVIGGVRWAASRAAGSGAGRTNSPD